MPVVFKPKSLKIRVVTEGKINQALVAVADRIGKEIKDYNEHQVRRKHRSGVGEQLPMTYSPSWRNTRRKKGLGLRPDLTYTGTSWTKLYNKNKVLKNGDVEITVTYRGDSARNIGGIQKKWGVTILGVTQEKLIELTRDFVQPNMAKVLLDASTMKTKEIKL